MMCRELQRLGLPRKKKSLHDSQRDTPRVRRLRRAFVRRVTHTLRPVVKRLKFLDESGAHLGLTRRCGRAAPGVRVVEATPGYSGPHYTLIAALGWSGLQAPWLLDGAMDTAAFEVYVQHVLAPTLRRGDVLLLDNLSAHASERARTLIEARGARLEFLPPYSPDLNPIEKCWAKVKEALRAAKARTLDDLIVALRQALLSLTHNDVVAWFAHCGYAIA
jgi:transposase